MLPEEIEIPQPRLPREQQQDQYLRDIEIAYRMFDSAQMAYAMGHQVTVFVDDAKKHNGHCYANSIQVKKK